MAFINLVFDGQNVQRFSFATNAELQQHDALVLQIKARGADVRERRDNGTLSDAAFRAQIQTWLNLTANISSRWGNDYLPRSIQCTVNDAQTILDLAVTDFGPFREHVTPAGNAAGNP